MSHKPPQCRFTVNVTQLNLQVCYDSFVFHPPALLIFCHHGYVPVLLIHSVILFIVSVCCHFMYWSGFCLCSRHLWQRGFSLNDHPDWNKGWMNDLQKMFITFSSTRVSSYQRGNYSVAFYLLCCYFNVSNIPSSVFTQSQWHEAGNTHTV